MHCESKLLLVLYQSNRVAFHQTRVLHVTAAIGPGDSPGRMLLVGRISIRGLPEVGDMAPSFRFWPKADMRQR